MKQRKRKKRNKRSWFRKYSLSKKFHHMWHIYEYVDIWKCLLEWCDEQSVETFHKICAKVLNRYRSQRGGLGLKFAMEHLMLITSPKYQG